MTRIDRHIQNTVLLSVLVVLEVMVSVGVLAELVVVLHRPCKYEPMLCLPQAVFGQ